MCRIDRPDTPLQQRSPAFPHLGQIVDKDRQARAEAEAFEDQTGECWFESEIQRLKGELLLDQRRDAAKAERLFDTAVQVARSQSARSLELRATMSLCRLWQSQGKREQARQALEPIYGWFTEGFDTADLQEAKALLQTLSQPKGS
jgi:predicted ATPase